MRLFPRFLSLLSVLAVTAHAAVDPHPPEGAASAAAPTASAVAPAAASSAPAAAGAGVPAIQIEWDCHGCEPNEKVPPLIESGYAGAAGAHNASIDEGEKAVVKITTFHQRNPAARVLLGIMAGKDQLAVRVTWHGKEATATEYAANAMHGMNAVAESLGKKTFVAVQRLVDAERSATATAAQ